jgi:hypothetical protein
MKLMKHIYLFLFLLISNLISAQDLRLYENTWHLTKIVQNGMDYFPPNNPEVPKITLTFNQQDSSLRTGGCNELGGPLTFENNLTNFILNHHYITLSLCNLQPYEPQYFSVFENYGVVANGFSYIISEVETLKTLTIISLTNKKQAIYSNQNLATIDFKELNFSIYSNPSTDLVMVELENQNTENIKVELFDSSGKICKSNYFNSNPIKISTADLSSGVYIIKITVGNEVGVKKFIKS